MRKFLIVWFLLMIIIYGKSQNYVPDQEFGIDGIVKIIKKNHYCIAYKIVQLQNKKYLCLTYQINEKTNQSSYMIFQINNDGSLDQAFGENGFVEINAGSLISKMDFEVYENDKILAIQSDVNGKIELDFIKENGKKISKKYISPFPNNYIIPVKISSYNNEFLIGGNYNSKLDDKEHTFLIKLDIEGNIDNSFADNGIILMEKIVGKNKVFQDFSLSGESIFILTSEVQSDSSVYTKMFKYNSNGNLDQNFSNAGVFQFHNYYFEDSYNLLLSEENIYIASKNFPIVLKLNYDGKIDENYGNSGWAKDDFILQKMSFPVFPKLMKDNSILFAGTSKSINLNQIEKAMILKYTAEGTIDKNFGDNGFFYSNIEYPSIFLYSAVDKDNKLVLAGAFEDTSNSNKSQTFISRYKESSVEVNIKYYNTDMVIFPNPVFNKNLTFVCPENLSPKSYRILDIYGRLIQEGNFVNTSNISNGYEIRLSDDISSNFYFLQILGDDLNVLLKFQKLR